MTSTRENLVEKFTQLWISNPHADGNEAKRIQMLNDPNLGNLDTLVKGYLDTLISTSDMAHSAIKQTLLAWAHSRVIMCQRKNRADYAPGEDTKRKKTDKNIRKGITDSIDPYLKKLKIPGGHESTSVLFVNIVMAAGRCEIGLNPLSPNPKIFGEHNKIETLRHDIWSACFGGSLYTAATCCNILREEGVLVLGETGTGKELVAEILSDGSFMAEEPKLYPLNVSALPAELVESLLFGYVKGAHNQADKDKEGLIEDADKNTLLLDEIADLNLLAQPKILRVLESRRILKLGDASESPIDVRFVAATNKNLYDHVKEDKFRDDLLHRLNGVIINTVPLRELDEDSFVDIARSLIRTIDYHMQAQAINKLTAEFKNRPWSGNMRELRNVIRSLALGRDLPRRQGQSVDSKQAATIESTTLPDFLNKVLALDITLKELKGEYIHYALGKLNNKTQVANALDFNISNFYKKKG